MSRLETCLACFEYGVSCPEHRGPRSPLPSDLSLIALDKAIQALEDDLKKLREGFGKEGPVPVTDVCPNAMELSVCPACKEWMCPCEPCCAGVDGCEICEEVRVCG